MKAEASGVFRLTASANMRVLPKNKSEIEASINRRLALIAEKNWTEADRIRDELLEKGIQLQDYKDPETGERNTKWEVKR